ncbi:MAG: hypothetical protein ACP5RF_02760 [Candidatus Micrarchaeia archaeon]
MVVEKEAILVFGSSASLLACSISYELYRLHMERKEREEIAYNRALLFEGIREVRRGYKKTEQI